MNYKKKKLLRKSKKLLNQLIYVKQNIIMIKKCKELNYLIILKKTFGFY